MLYTKYRTVYLDKQKINSYRNHADSYIDQINECQYYWA